MILNKIVVPIVSVFIVIGAVNAAESVDLKVTGTLTNATCNPEITDGGVIDMGHIPVKNMQAETTVGYQITKYQHTKIDLTITCSTAMAVAFDLIDNKSGTVPSSFSAYHGKYGFGKTVDEKNIGMYQLYQNKTFIDGVEGTSLYTPDNGKTWIRSNSLEPNNRYSFGKKDEMTVAPGKLFKFTMDSTFYFDKSVVDEMSDEIPYEGSATFTLVYL